MSSKSSRKLKKKKKKNEEQYAAEAQNKMSQLKEEVNINVEEFLNSSQTIKAETV